MSRSLNSTEGLFSRDGEREILAELVASNKSRGWERAGGWMGAHGSTQGGRDFGENRAHELYLCLCVSPSPHRPPLICQEVLEQRPEGKEGVSGAYGCLRAKEMSVEGREWGRVGTS